MPVEDVNASNVSVPDVRAVAQQLATPTPPPSVDGQVASEPAPQPAVNLFAYRPTCPPLGSQSYVSFEHAGLKVHPTLVKTVEETICPDTGFSPQYFWSCLGCIVKELTPELEQCLARRDEIQALVDSFYENGGHVQNKRDFLRDVGYIKSDGGPVSVTTQFVDPEIAKIPAPQLVVPSDNARYVLNAINARWGSLFDALYGFDVIPEFAVFGRGNSGYNPVRGDAVIEFANELLDEIVPLVEGSWKDVVRLWPRFIASNEQLIVLLKSGEVTSLKAPSQYVGSVGSLGPPQGTHTSIPGEKVMFPDSGRLFLKHNGLHLILEIDRQDPVGQRNPSGIKDITMESALSTIIDMEDSVSAVDAEDKAKVYKNVNHIFRGLLEAPVMKDGKAFSRRMRRDQQFRDANGHFTTLPGRAVALVRNVGHHMFTDAVITEDGKGIPEGFLDCLVTVASAIHDMRGMNQRVNSRTGSVYIVKPKQHGPEEVALTCKLFTRTEELFGLRRNTIKMGVMDEERRTSVNLKECVRAASERVFFINTGFLDRTGDEIHTCMSAGPVCRKADMKQQPWIKAYEANNVDVGLHAGLHGKGQIGKGMWARPDSMKAMLNTKLGELSAGASTAWVPSPAAATLHSIHYHRVDVSSRQSQLSMRAPAMVDDMCEPPLLKAPSLMRKEDISRELQENAQSILGYVVRWIDLGIGCSKVPDLSNVGLMEDRATLRISSQLLANWLHHGMVSEPEVRQVFAEMARVVDQQNFREPGYKPMACSLDTNVAFQAALKLVLDGRKAPNGYTEFTLHEARRQAKASVVARL